MTTKSIALSSMLISLSIVLSYVEMLFPPLSVVPGMKIGLANIVVVFSLYVLGFKKTFLISIVRVFASSLLFGSMVSLVYSLSGALVSLLVMQAMKKSSLFGIVTVSISGAVVHNMTQLAVCYVFFRTSGLFFYAPVLIAGSVAGGAAVGLAGWTVIRRTGFLAEEIL